MSWSRFALGGVLLGVATAMVIPFASRGVRSVRMLTEPAHAVSTHFDRRQSAALFVGVQKFADDSVEKVRFAVDDAVDLAYVFALEPRVRLVPPRRVVLLLSGTPAKPQSRDRLRALRDAGADVRHADVDGIRTALRDQAALAGRDGILVVSIATHGFVREGSGYILGASSILRDTGTTLSLDKMLDVIASSPAQRSIVFVDACRERMISGTRTVLAGAMGGAPVAHRLNRAHGQAVFYAAAPGRVAFDDAGNGIFTKAVISGINCGAAKVRGAVTAETLARYVERYVHTWIRDNRDRNVGSATQATIDGEARNMALAQCSGPPPAFGPARVVAGGSVVRGFSETNALLWAHDVGAAIVWAAPVDLDADGAREVVCRTRDSVIVLDANGTILWSAHEPMMDLTALLTADLRRQPTNEVIALWRGPHSPASRLAVYAPDGRRLGTFITRQRIDRVAIGRPTSRYNPRIVATSGNVLLVFDLRRLQAGKPLWAGRVRGRIESIEIVDCNGDGKDDIALVTDSGARVFVDFTGHVIQPRSAGRFQRVAPSRALSLAR